MPSDICKILVVIIIGILSVSKSDDGIITVPTVDIPSDGKGLPPAANGDTNISTVIPEVNNPSLISNVLGIVYRYTGGPAIRVMLIFLEPIFSLIRGITSPISTIINYLLASLGLPSAWDLVNEVLIGLEGYLTRVLGQISGFVGALMGSQDNPQVHSRSRRSIAGTLMSPITAPLGFGWSLIGMPWKILKTTSKVITKPLSWTYTGLSYPASGAMRLGSWGTRGILRMFGWGGRKVDENGNEGEEQDPIEEVVGAMSEAVQDALAEAAIEGFQVLKSDILPAIDSAVVNYQDSDMIPESFRGYMKKFHQAYSLLHTLRLL